MAPPNEGVLGVAAPSCPCGVSSHRERLLLPGVALTSVSARGVSAQPLVSSRSTFGVSSHRLRRGVVCVGVASHIFGVASPCSALDLAGVSPQWPAEGVEIYHKQNQIQTNCKTS